MCGPTDSEKQLEASEQSFSNTLQSAFNTQFAGQQTTLNSLNATLTPVVEAGASQAGFSAAESAALNTQAINSTGANYANAARAVGDQLAAHGGNAPGGQSTAISGIDSQIKGALASSAAGELSKEQTGITEANYAQGNKNYEAAVGGLENLAGLQNPEGYASAQTSANKSAFGESDTIQQQQNALVKDITGGITSLASSAMGGFGNLDTTGGSSFGEQVQNFLGGA